MEPKFIPLPEATESPDDAAGGGSKTDAEVMTDMMEKIIKVLEEQDLKLAHVVDVVERIKNTLDAEPPASVEPSTPATSAAGKKKSRSK